MRQFACSDKGLRERKIFVDRILERVHFAKYKFDFSGLIPRFTILTCGKFCDG